MANFKTRGVEVRQLIKTSKLNHRNGFYKVLKDSVLMGFIEKGYYWGWFEANPQGDSAHQTFNTLQQAVSYLVK